MCRVGRSGNRRLDARDRIKLILAAYFMWEARLPSQARSFLATHQSDRFCRNLPLSLIERTEAATTSRIMVELTWTETVIGRWNCIGTGVHHCNRRSGVVL